jgi:DNA-binding response OmpR family regulator
MLEKVLVIDDEINFLESISIGLKRSGFDVEIAENGEYGLQKFKENKCNYVICDLDLPDCTGWDVALKIIRDDPKTKIIFITAGIIRNVNKKFIHYHILNKPFEFKELLKLLIPS